MNVPSFHFLCGARGARTAVLLALLAGLAATCSGSPERTQEDQADWRHSGDERIPDLRDRARAPERKRPLRLLFAGDTHFEWGVLQEQEEDNLYAPVEDVRTMFADADFRAVNLESSLAEDGKPFLRKSYIFNAAPEQLRVLRYLQVDLALLGNNHAMDMGAQGLEDTLANLRRAGVAATGAGENSRAAGDPYRFHLHGRSFGVLSYSSIGAPSIFSNSRRPGVASIPSDSARTIRVLAQETDHVIVSLHWGSEYSVIPGRDQRDLARSMIEAGADAVIGHHPHVPHGLELYRDGVIIYSLGNFLFGSANEQQDHNVVAQLEFHPEEKKLQSVRLFPVWGRYRDAGNRVRRLNEEEAREFWHEYYALTEAISPESAKAIRVLEDGTGYLSVMRLRSLSRASGATSN